VDIGRLGRDIFFHRGWRYVAVASPGWIVMAGVALLLYRDVGAALFFLAFALGHAIYGVVNWRREKRLRPEASV
jgi:hypothetical protein